MLESDKHLDNIENIKNNSATINQNRADILDHQRRFQKIAPIGTIIAWYGKKQFFSEKDIPPGWQLCNGSAILFGPLAGQTTPELNNKGLFLRGGWGDEVGQTEDDAIQDHLHKDEEHCHVVRL